MSTFHSFGFDGMCRTLEALFLFSFILNDGRAKPEKHLVNYTFILLFLEELSGYFDFFFFLHAWAQKSL